MTELALRQRELLLAAALLTVVTALWLVFSTPASGYELSVYGHYHPLFWILFCGSLVTGTGALYLSIETSAYRWRSFVIVLSSYGLFAAIPEFRGYALFGRTSDLLQHIGWTKSLLDSGDLTIYPGFHILMALLRLLGIPYDTHRLLFAILPLALWIIGIGLYTREIASSRRAGVFAMVAAIPLALGEFHLLFHPAIKSFLLTPLALFVAHRYIRSGEANYLGPVLVFMFAFVILHPITAILFILMIGVFHIVARFRSGRPNVMGEPPILIALAGGCALTIWLLVVGRGAKAVSAVLIRIIPTQGEGATQSGGGGGSVPTSATGEGIFGNIASYLDAVAVTPTQMILRFVEFYGVTILFLGLAYGVVLWGTWRWYISRRVDWTDVHISTQYLAGLFVTVGFILIPLIVSDPVRVSRYAVLFGGIIIAIGLWRVSTNPSPQRYHRVGTFILMGCLIVVLLPGGVMMAYPTDYHLTHTEEEGIEFIIDRHNPTHQVTGLRMDQRQVAYMMDARHASEHHIFKQTHPANPKGFPHRLGPSDERLNESLEGGYLITKDSDIAFMEYYFETQLDDLTYYTESDRERIQGDPSAGRVYSNGPFELWRVSNDTQST